MGSGKGRDPKVTLEESKKKTTREKRYSVERGVKFYTMQEGKQR